MLLDPEDEVTMTSTEYKLELQRQYKAGMADGLKRASVMLMEEAKLRWANNNPGAGELKDWACKLQFMAGDQKK